MNKKQLGDDECSVLPNSSNSTRRKIGCIKLIQNVLLIWLDENINTKDNFNCPNVIKELEQVVNHVKTFTSTEPCVEFITEEINNEKACMIISGALGERVIPQIHDLLQIDSIFIFCRNEQYHKQWAKAWSKIKGVFIKISAVCDALKETVKDCEHNSMSMSVVQHKLVDQLDPNYMYTQILKEILLSIKFKTEHFQQFINDCRKQFAGNEDELKYVETIEDKYSTKSPIFWYTCESFLYPMLNRGLRSMDVDIIIKMGFFIADLHRDIERLHSKQFSGPRAIRETFTVYRGQGMMRAEFETLQEAKDGLLSFNNFLSTSKNLEVSRRFAYRALQNPNLVGVIFVMTINPADTSTPFAALVENTRYKKEDEILFSMHTVFRISKVTKLKEKQNLFQVDLKLTSDNDPILSQLAQGIREELFPHSEGWYRLGELLIKIGRFDSAEELCEILLGQAKMDIEKAHLYNQLGRVKRALGELKQAKELHQKILN